jgi:hypothetical protein
MAAVSVELWTLFGAVPLVAGVALGAAIWHFFSEDRRIQRRIAALPVRRIGELGDGETARVVGRVRAGATLVSPLTGRTCVYYRAILEEYRQHGKFGAWHVIADASNHVDFSVVDDGGEALVRMIDPTVSVNRDAHTRSGLWEDPDDLQRAFVEAHGGSAENFLGMNRALRYTEGVIEPDEAVSVVGQVVLVGPGVRVLEPMDAGGLLVSDEAHLTVG